MKTPATCKDSNVICCAAQSLNWDMQKRGDVRMPQNSGSSGKFRLGTSHHVLTSCRAFSGLSHILMGRKEIGAAFRVRQWSWCMTVSSRGLAIH